MDPLAVTLAEVKAFADLFEPLTGAQCRTPASCAGWTVDNLPLSPKVFRPL
jgi:putative component of membrane protein insertase Oxa1/YidC/SpoIIIJ protein YidD